MGHRAQELKRELARPTIKLPDHRASGYEQDLLLGVSRYGRKRRRSLFLPLCIAFLLGALSTTIPVAGTFTLQGTLTANAEPALPTAVPAPEGALGRAVVLAEPAECPWTQLGEPAIATIDIPGQSDLLLSASILSIEAHTVDTVPACRIELALLPEGDEATILRGLPLGAATRADFPTTRSWMGAFMAQLPSDSRQAIEKASGAFQVVSGWVKQMWRGHVAPHLPKASSAPAKTR